MEDRVRIFDTTLRDGEQSPGASMTVQEKLEVARQLAALGVDIIEAGFAISSAGDFEAIRMIAGEVEGPVVCSLARAREGDIDRAAEAIREAPRKRIHTFHSTSDIHLKYQYRIDRDEALKRSREMVAYARSLVDDVEFSPMDATRTDTTYLCEVIEAVISAGAGTVNIPDTVGYTTPEEFGRLIAEIHERVPNARDAIISVHCHNDLGMAVANSLAAVLNGCRQVECTVNGIGERAGNCSMEEVVMALKTRRDFYGIETALNTREIIRTSRLVSKITGINVQPNKAIVGANAFAHEAGIHQDGLLKDKSTYEIIRPEDVGLGEAKLVLGKHSGRNAFRTRLKDLGFELSPDELESAFERFKNLADQKKEVYDEDLEALVTEEVERSESQAFVLEDLSISSGLGQPPMATVRMSIRGESHEHTARGDGPVDAVYRCITALTDDTSKLMRFDVKGITEGTDAMGEVTVMLGEDELTVRGHGADTDIIVASAKAYLNALNRLEILRAKQRDGRIIPEKDMGAEKP